MESVSSSMGFLPITSEAFAGNFSSACAEHTEALKKVYAGGAESPLFVGSLGKYVQNGELGNGTFGYVIQAVDNEAQPPIDVAIKLLPRGNFIKNFKTYVHREILHQSSLKHPFIISLREVFLTPTHLAIAMEYAKGGNLFHYLLQHTPHCRLTEAKAQWIFQQLIIGLDYCHRRGVANRDLKLENLLLDREEGPHNRPLLKICDFGYSKHEMNSSAKTHVGTPIYMAPEIVLGSNRYNAKMADIWSTGVILYAILFGRYPFYAQEQENIPRRIVDAAFAIPPDVPVSASCVDLVTRILVADPRKRLCMDGIKRHPWFLKDLPPGALDMNDFYLQAPPFLGQCMPRGDVTLQREQLLSDAGCLPVQYKEGVYSLVKQAQLVGHTLDPCTGVKSSP